MCGDLVYNIQVTSAYSDTSAIAVTMTARDELTSADVAVYTDVQEFALHEGRVNGEWRTLYQIHIEAQFIDYHATEVTFSFDPINFYIRDYCANLLLSGVPEY